MIKFVSALLLIILVCSSQTSSAQDFRKLSLGEFISGVEDGTHFVKCNIPYDFLIQALVACSNETATVTIRDSIITANRDESLAGRATMSDEERLDLYPSNRLVHARVEIVNCILHEANFFGTVFEQSVSFKGCIFTNNPVFFQEAKFLNTADFSQTVFADSVSFQNCTFNETASVQSATFLGGCLFGKAQFAQSVKFIGSGFRGFTFFQNSRFHRAADFSEAVFAMSSAFTSAEFEGWADFHQAAFHAEDMYQQHDFADTEFLEAANFKGLAANRVHFEGAKFHKTVSFADSEIGEASFENAIFEAPTDFANTKFTGDRANFVGTHFQRVVFGAGTNKELTFNCVADFTRAVFSNEAYFSFVVFGSTARFEYAELKDAGNFQGLSAKDINFSHADFNGIFFLDHSTMTEGLFEGAKFHQKASFRNCGWLDTMRFSGATFDNDVSFKGGCSTGDGKCALWFDDVVFRGKVYLDDLNVMELYVYGDISPSVFEREVFCRRSTVREMRFSSVEFQRDAHFESIRIKELLSFKDTLFGGGLNLSHAELPSSSTSNQTGLVMSDVLMNGSLVVDVDLFKRSFCEANGVSSTKTDMDIWLSLEDAFHRAGNLQGENYTKYQYLLAQSTASNFLSKGKAANYLSWLFWGYGLKPLRVVCWMCVLFISSFWIYWSQTKQLSKTACGENLFDRLRFTLNFTVQTSLRFDFGPKNSRTIPFKLLTSFHAVAFKVLGFFFLTALSNVNPLLNALVSKALVF